MAAHIFRTIRKRMNESTHMVCWYNYSETWPLTYYCAPWLYKNCWRYIDLFNKIDAKRINSLSKTVVNLLEKSVAHTLIVFTEFLWDPWTENEGESNPVFSLFFYCQMVGRKWASSPVLYTLDQYDTERERYTKMPQQQEHKKCSFGWTHVTETK